jgi:hypothetical protein
MAAPPAPGPGGSPSRLVATAEVPPLRWLASVALALLRRPSLVPIAVRQVVRLAPAGWWRRRPFVPVPPAAYLGFRSQTMYGEADRLPDPADVCTYLRWCREFPKGQG